MSEGSASANERSNMNNQPQKLPEHAREMIRKSLETEGFAPDNIEQMLNEVVICQSREKPEEQVEEYALAPNCAPSSEVEEEVLMVADELRPKILYRELAKYTDLAYENKVEGTVLLSVVFTKDATVNGIRVIRGLPNGLTESAIAAVKRIRFEAARKDGKPVSVRGKVEISFKI